MSYNVEEELSPFVCDWKWNNFKHRILNNKFYFNTLHIQSLESKLVYSLSMKIFKHMLICHLKANCEGNSKINKEGCTRLTMCFVNLRVYGSYAERAERES
jgi:hypothetical protein